MQVFRGFWDRLRDNVLAPKFDAEDLERELRRARAKLPTPVFWLLGKAQAGKTSIIRALTGSTRAEIGDGFRACTRTSQLYAYPNEEECLVRFLDTRGLGEVGYDPADDLRVHTEQAHLLMVVVRAMDHAQSAVLDAARQAKRANPQWPVIVVQTSLHEGYEFGAKHIEPYPDFGAAASSAVPRDLARSLAAQRDLFAGIADRFVAVDFTLPEDGFDPEFYGLEALWQSIEDILPLGLRGILEQQQELRSPLRDAYFHAARPHVVAYATAAGAAAAVPVPLVDMPLVLAIQAKMFHTIASIYGQRMSAQTLAEIGGALGAGMLTRFGGRELSKLVPGIGVAASSVYAAASTYALGCTLCAYFSHVRKGDVPDAQKIRELYAEELAEGRNRMREYLSKLRK